MKKVSYKKSLHQNIENIFLITISSEFLAAYYSLWCGVVCP